RRTAERLATILTDRSQAVREACAQRLDYRPRVRLTPLDQPELREAWAQAFAGAELVIIDSLARALAQLGRDESSNADMAQFAVQYLDTIGGRGPAVLLLDNTGWGEPERSRGASNKWDLCELVYRVTADAISVERHGTIRLERVRSRDGDEAEHLHVGAGGGSYGQLQPALPGEHDRQLDRELLAHVHEHPGESVETIAKAVAKRKNRARSRLLALEQDGTVHSSPSQRRDRRGRTTTFTGWYPGPQSQQATVPEHGTDPDRHSSEPQVVPTVRPLKGGTGTADRTNVDDGPRT
ncbi:MAG TPA: hypothetical protein VED41_02450, partial [Solirubrobacteraceae bacterium]|nr:hypothetical protein [Solirubrobacteraceae bacterium]